MKFRLTFKTPDVIDQLTEELFLSEEELDVKDFLKKWVKYGEYVSIDFDMNKGTAQIVVKERD